MNNISHNSILKQLREEVDYLYDNLYHENKKYILSSSQIIPFNNVSIPIEEWGNQEITFFGSIGLLLFTQSFCIKNVESLPDISVHSSPLVSDVDGFVNVLVYPGLHIVFQGGSPSGIMELIMPIPLPPLMAPSKQREIVIFDREEDFDPFGFVSQQFVPFNSAIVRIDQLGNVSLVIDMMAINQPLEVTSTELFVLQFKL